MKKYVDNIEKITLENSNFRQVLFTGEHCQLVAMSLRPGEDIGMEVHPNVDQFLRFESGEGKVIINGEESAVVDGSAVIVTAGSEHNIVNTSADKDLKLYTIYSPPNHPDGTIHKTKKEALAYEKEHH
jgi:mannose-6-phosphate isomerase-like protein (cupin superfamily)